MKLATRLLTATALLAVSACAAPVYTAVFPGNDSPPSAGYDQMLLALEAFDPLFDASQLSLLTKFDPVVDGAVQNNVTIVVSTTNDDDEGLSGTWSSTVPIALITIKATNDFKAVYYGIPGDFSGTWDTTLIGNGNQGVSHISFFTYSGLPDDPTVPEPSTWLMMSAGVAALAGRRFFRS